MKNIIIALLLLNSSLSNSQNWCPSGAEWKINYQTWAGFGIYDLKYEKDTLIGQTICKKINGNLKFGPHPQVGVPQVWNDTIAIEPLFTYSKNDTVFFYYDNQLRPVYYFNAKVGDTVYFHNPVCLDDINIQQIVDTVGTININGNSLRYYTTRNINTKSFLLYPHSMRVVEKLGALDQYLLPAYTCFSEIDSYDFRCYEDDNFPLHQSNPNAPCDPVITGTNEVDESFISISPNPAGNSLKIHNSSNDNIQRITIYDNTGKLLRLILNQDNETVISIDIPELMNGMYNMQIVTLSGKTLVKRFIKNLSK